MKIIEATPEHIDSVVILFDLYRQFYQQKPDIHSAKEFLTNRIKNKESVIFLAIDEEKNKAAGFVQLYPSFSSVNMKRVWILNDLFVHSDFRRRGVAEALIEESKELAVKTNAVGIILETHTSNVNAQKLYEKIGFKKDEEHFYYFLEAE